MTDTPFIVKNGLIANTNFTANGTFITLTANIQITPTYYSVGNTSFNSQLTSNTLTINYPNGYLFVNYNQISTTNNAFYVQNLGAAAGLYLSAPGYNTTILGNLIVNNTASFSTTYLNNISNVTSQGVWLGWNKLSGDGGTWLINQKGGGTGGIYFGESSNNNIFTGSAYIAPAGSISTVNSSLIVNGSLAVNNLIQSTGNNSQILVYDRTGAANGFAAFYRTGGVNRLFDVNSGDVIQYSTNSINLLQNTNCTNIFGNSVSFSNGTIGQLNASQLNGTSIGTSGITFPNGFQVGNQVSIGLYYDTQNIALRSLSSNSSIFFQSYAGNTTFGILGPTLGAGGGAGATFPSLNVNGLATATTVSGSDNSQNLATSAAVRNILNYLGSASLGSTGSITIPGCGLIIKWTNATPSNQGLVTWTFGTPFPNACIFADGAPVDSSSGTSTTNLYNNLNNTTITFYCKKVGSSGTVINSSVLYYFIAIGY